VNISTHDIGLESLDALSGVDSLCLFVSEDERPLKGTSGFADWRLCGALSRVLLRGFFTGAPNDWLLLPAKERIPVARIFVAGLGKSQQLTASGLGEALSAAAKTLSRAKADGVALEVPGAGTLDENSRAAALKQAFLSEFRGSRVAVFSDKPLARLLGAK
jgi:hypothetical protein